MTTNQEFNRPVKRQAEFIQPPNKLKRVVGDGGLSDEILNRAEALIQENTTDFVPLAQLYLNRLSQAVDSIRKHSPELADQEKQEQYISLLIYPTMHLKANGAMFKYPLISTISNRMVNFLEVIDRIDHDVIELFNAYETTIRAIIAARITGDGGPKGKALIDALVEACERYFEKNPANTE